MFHNCNPQDGQLLANLRRATIALSVLAESHRSLLEENAAKDKTIKSFEEKVLELQQKLDDSEDENLELQQEVDSLKDENLELRQRVDPFSPDCLSIEDSFDEEY